MSRFVFCVVLVVGLIPSLSTSSVAARDTKADDKAKEIYGQFVKAMKAKDLEGMMKLVDVPFLDSSKQVIRDKKDLNKEVKGFCDGIEDTSKVKSDIKEVLSYPRFRKRFKENEDNKEFLKLLDEMKLTNDDRVIVETWTGYLIRIRDGKAKIVGVFE